MLKVIICFRGLRFVAKDPEVWKNYKWDKLKIGERIYSDKLKWYSVENSAILYDKFPDRIFLNYDPKQPECFNTFLEKVECTTIASFSSSLIDAEIAKIDEENTD